jgi:hypothetical protein
LVVVRPVGRRRRLREPALGGELAEGVVG